jgi:hypothetical protein
VPGDTSAEPRGFVLFKGDRAYFKRGVAGEVELEARVRREELASFVRWLDALGKARETESGLWIYDEDLYQRAAVFAALSSSVKAGRPLKLLKLAEVVRGMDGYSLYFWYTEAVGSYRREGIKGVERVARAARILYKVDRK